MSFPACLKLPHFFGKARCTFPNALPPEAVAVAVGRFKEVVVVGGLPLTRCECMHTKSDVLESGVQMSTVQV